MVLDSDVLGTGRVKSSYADGGEWEGVVIDSMVSGRGFGSVIISWLPD